VVICWHVDDVDAAFERLLSMERRGITRAVDVLKLVIAIPFSHDAPSQLGPRVERHGASGVPAIRIEATPGAS
jgi:hypothetical protein